MKHTRFLSVLLLTLFVAVPAWAAFDEQTISPRARAMGEASVAVPGDAWSFRNNPALLGEMTRTLASSSTMQPYGISGLQLRALGISTPLPSARGGVAFGFQHWSVDRGNVNLTREQTLSFAHGIRLYEDTNSSAYIGWGANFYNADFGQTVSGLEPGSAWTWGVDVGVAITLYERTRAAFLTRNLNNPTIGEDQEELRQMVSAGIAYEPYDGVVTTFDIRGQLGEEMRFHGGLEFAVLEVLDLRFGVMTDPNKLTGGFGVHLPRLISFDYAFSTGGGTLDESHQFGLSVRFGAGGTGR